MYYDRSSLSTLQDKIRKSVTVYFGIHFFFHFLIHSRPVMQDVLVSRARRLRVRKIAGVKKQIFVVVTRT